MTRSERAIPHMRREAGPRTHYHVGYNLAGCLPEDDPAVFNEYRQAMAEFLTLQAEYAGEPDIEVFIDPCTDRRFECRAIL